jgi:uncharacterized secreted repeat protein (TIGR03808 family)
MLHAAMPLSRITRRALLAGAGASGLALAANPGISAEALSGALDATRLGVRADSSDDQSEALRIALAAAEAERRPLFLPPGRYAVTAVELPPNAMLIGVPGETRLVYRGGGSMLRARPGDRLRLDGIVLDGVMRPISAGGLLSAEDIAEAIVENCAFTGSAASGIALQRCGGRIAATNVAACRMVGVQAAESRGLSIFDNVVRRCGDTGMLIIRAGEGPDDTILRGNRVSAISALSGGTGQYGNGINIAKANGVVVDGNRIDDCAFSAIRCFSADHVALTGNIATNSGEVAIYVEFASEGAVVSANIIDGAAYGISFANFAEHGGRLAVCTGNLVRNISGVSRLPRGEPLTGSGIGAEADIAITGNVVENAEHGLELGWGPYLRDVSAMGNILRNVGVGIAVSVVEGAGTALIRDNLVSGARQAAIRGMRWAEPATGELVNGDSSAYPHLSITGNRVS